MANDRVGQLVVLAAADTMHEQVADQQPREHGRHQCTRSQQDTIDRQLHPIIERIGAIERAFDNFLPPSLIAEHEIVALRRTNNRRRVGSARR